MTKTFEVLLQIVVEADSPQSAIGEGITQILQHAANMEAYVYAEQEEDPVFSGSVEMCYARPAVMN